MTTLPADAPARRRAWSNPLLALVRFFAVFSVSLGVFLVICTLQALPGTSLEKRRRIAARWIQRWARLSAACLGYRLRIRGALPPPGALLAPNHAGYADIFALGAAVPCFFVPRGDMAAWPFVGTLVRHTEQIFASRRRGARDLSATADALQERLAGGHLVCTFLEGTSSGGDGVLPFHASLLQPAINIGAPVVPVAIRWSSTRPAVDPVDDIAYWRAEHSFLPHFWRHLGLGGFEVDITFDTPIASAGLNRKVLAAAVRSRILLLRGDVPAA